MGEREETQPESEETEVHSGETADTESGEDRAGSSAPVEAASESDQAQSRLREVEGRLRAVSKAYADLEGDMAAFRQRMTALADQRVERKAGELIEQFFDPVQNLRRSMQAKDADPAATIAGLEMILQQFTEVFAKLGLREIPGIGAAFDPLIHEALATMPVTDPASDGRVLLVYATGYRIGDRVLQPAKVVIGKLADTVAEA